MKDPPNGPPAVDNDDPAEDDDRDWLTEEEYAELMDGVPDPNDLGPIPGPGEDPEIPF